MKGLISQGQAKTGFICFHEISSGRLPHAGSHVKHLRPFIKVFSMKNICNHKHRYNPSFKLLSENQGQIGRHKCSGCADALGFWHAEIGIAMATDDSVLVELPESQAGSVRHKDAFEAYQNGYRRALAMKMKQAA